MPFEIRMPDLATTDDAVTLVRWLVEVGTEVQLNQPLLEIETDKATMEVESIAAGVLQAIHAQPGDRVSVGQVIAIIIAEGERAAQVETREIKATTTAESVHHEASGFMTDTERDPPTTVLHEVVTADPSAAPRASLFRQNQARRQKLAEGIPLTSLQRDVARRLNDAKRTIPHFYLDTSANAEAMIARRSAGGRKLVWDAFFVQAAARALRDFEKMQYRFEGELLTRNPNAIGVALDIEDALFVMPVEDPLSMTLEQLSEQILERARRIKVGDAAARRLGDTWLTISNLGGQNVERIHAIVNPPGAAILGIGKIAPQVIATAANQIAIQQRVSLSLSVDHRVVNGRYAARFLEKIVAELETP
jgi:pyruvate dehydrogenase E2 component (dihydrolipoamide acetyltransferase)